MTLGHTTPSLPQTVGLTNKEKVKTKNYLMLSKSHQVMGKQKLSLKSVKRGLTKHLATLSKTTKLASKIRKRKGR